MSNKEGCWEKELFGWDDSDVYVFHSKRGNFSIKKHRELHDKIVEIAIKYFEEHNVKSEEELRSKSVKSVAERKHSSKLLKK